MDNAGWQTPRHNNTKLTQTSRAQTLYPKASNTIIMLVGATSMIRQIQEQCYVTGVCMIRLLITQGFSWSLEKVHTMDIPFSIGFWFAATGKRVNGVC